MFGRGLRCCAIISLLNKAFMYLIETFLETYQKELHLEVLTGDVGMKKGFRSPHVQRPGLSLSGYLKRFASDRMMILGRQEISYIRDLEPGVAKKRLQKILSAQTPAIIVSSRQQAPEVLLDLCTKMGIALFRSTLSTGNLFSRVAFLLKVEFSPSMTCHGTLVEAFGVGILIQGDSSVGKSETALGLIERGHRLISDDIVKVRLTEGAYLEGTGPELTRHLMEIRGIGIINVAHLYGAVCVRDYKGIDLIVRLEKWDDNHFYDRIGLEEKYCEMLGLQLPFHVLPLKPGRDVVLLIETIALNHRLKEMGLHSAREFNAKLIETIAKKQGRQRREVSAKSKS